MLFNSIWSLLVLAYLAVTPRFLERFYHSFMALGLLVTTVIFWFAGSIALAVRVGVPNCSGDGGVFCSSARTAQAAVAFGFFIWAIFAALAAFDGLGFLKGGARADTTRKPGPAPQVSTV